MKEQLTTWTNSNGKEFQIKHVSPFLEDEIRTNMTWPVPPQYQVTQFSPDGGEFFQYYAHSPETMTEISEDPANDSNLITHLPSSDGKMRRWHTDSNSNERRSWTAYQLSLLESEQQFARKLMKLVLLEGVIGEPSEDWSLAYAERMSNKNLSSEDAKYAYVLNEVCTSEDDLLSLFMSIQKLRQISAERVAAFENSFRSQP